MSVDDCTAAAAVRRRRAWKPNHNPWVIALTVTLATFMEVLDTSIANVALPHIAGNLSAEHGREHVGAQLVPGGQRGDPADQRVARDAVRAASGFT